MRKSCLLIHTGRKCTGKYGISSRCKNCADEVNEEYRQKNSDDLKRKSREKYIVNRERYLEYFALRRKSPGYAEKQSAYHKEYRKQEGYNERRNERHLERYYNDVEYRQRILAQSNKLRTSVRSGILPEDYYDILLEAQSSLCGICHLELYESNTYTSCNA